MEPQETRYQLARHGAQLEEIAKNVSRLIDLSENIARIQERENDRDDKLARLVKKGDEQGARIGCVEQKLTASTSWAKGVMAVITAVLMPVSGAVMFEVLHDIPAIERRVQILEVQTHTPTTGMK